MFSPNAVYQKRDNRKIKNQEGFLLVEAAILWPLMMLVLFFIIYLTFALYNQATSLAVINFATENFDCLAGEEVFKEEESHIPWVDGLIEDYRNRFLLPDYPIEIDMGNAFFDEKITIIQHEKHPLVLLNKIGLRHQYKSTSAEGYILREADFINKSDVFKESI